MQWLTAIIALALLIFCVWQGVGLVRVIIKRIKERKQRAKSADDAEDKSEKGDN